MSYFLLTGATGLLGNYLLRDLLLADVPVAVIGRSNRRQSARQRIEVAMCGWDAEAGRALPRPVVMEGDISQPDLGLNANDVRWVAEYCSAIINNAASLTFHSTSKEGEPWRSNVGGTRNVLDFCRTTGIRQFHHVSTAYVAGLRQGRVLESELNVGQQFSNDYERSKLESETMVRNCDFIDTPTIFRPAIIIGDSMTGLTTTYHGFYAALKLTHTIIQAFPQDLTGLVGDQPVRLTLNGTETKHLVPVDWVSAFMTHVLTHPRLHGQTYHLTPKHPVTTRLIRDVLEQTTGTYGSSLIGPNEQPGDPTEAERLFYEHIRVYNSYWKMDPIFDRTNTEAAAPHLACPHVSRDLLTKLSRIVIDDGFPEPSKRPVVPEFDVVSLLTPLLEQTDVHPPKSTDERLLGLDVCGHGGGQWQVIVRGEEIVGIETGLHEDRLATCRLNVETLASLAQGQRNWDEAFNSGAAVIQGNGRTLHQYAKLLEQMLEQTVN